jgi:hypothetical protein
MKLLSIVMDQAELYEFVFKNDYATQIKNRLKWVLETKKDY